MLPGVHVGRLWRVYDDGNHNAFTDLCRFGDHLYLTFRSCPEGHMLFTSSRIVVLRSRDTQEWDRVFSFGVSGRDVRDPHFLVFENRLFVYSGTWLVNPDDPHDTNMSEQLGYTIWSDDGVHWHGPEPMEDTHGYYIWRAAAHGESAYLNGRRVKNFQQAASRPERDKLMESWLLQSQDGFGWSPVGLIQPNYGDETAFLFETDGSILAVARSAGGRDAQLCHAPPPYTNWVRHDLGRAIGGPMLAKWGTRHLVGGRKTLDAERPVTALYWLIGNQLQEIMELPSGGDNSYPGFVELGPDHGLLSYYSSHEGSGNSLAPCHIYLAELRLCNGV